MPINLVCSATRSSMEVAMATAAGQLKAVGQLAAVQQIWKAAGQLAAVQQIWKIWKTTSSKLTSIVARSPIQAKARAKLQSKTLCR
jgi:hypothetical protein